MGHAHEDGPDLAYGNGVRSIRAPPLHSAAQLLERLPLVPFARTEEAAQTWGV